MKALLSLIILGALVVSGYAQTRNVLVGTNNAVVQPTNFWSADASNARTGLGLGTAATNPATAFQPSSSVLSNLSSNNGLGITNLQASNLVGVIPSSNIPSTTLTNISGTLSIASGGTGATNASNARVNLGATAVGDALFISTNASAARTAIGASSVGSSIFTAVDAAAVRSSLSLGTASTNPSSSFQASSLALSNLALSNGGALTNLQATSIVGVIPSSNIPSVTFSNLSGTLPIAQGGTSATNASNARQNLGSTVVGDAVFIATNAAVARTAIGAIATNGDATNLTNFPASLLRTNGSGAGLTNLTAANITGTVALASNVSGTIAISNGGTGATNAGGARTNLGATTIGNALFTATNATVGKAALDLSPTSNITLNQVDVNTLFVSDGTNGIQFETTDVAAITRTNLGIGAGATNTVGFGKIRMSSFGLVIEEPINDVAVISFPIDTDPVTLSSIHWNDAGVRQSLGFSTNLTSFWTATNVAAARTNLGIPLAALTNTNNADFLAAFFGANTNPVLVNTNGEVVSPTNFWQAAPITTTFIESQPTTNFTTNISPARFLHIHSLATNIGNTTNTIVLPTNTLTFEGDVAIVVHKGPTNSMTRVQRAGSTNNLITLTRFDEAVQFVYYNDVWQFDHNVAFVEPIYFAGTNAVANAAASRTNLGLGASNSVEFNQITIDNNAFIGGDLTANNALNIGTNGAIYFVAAGQTRTNLGLGATNIVTFGGLTNNGDITINQTTASNGLLFIRRTNNEPFLGLANLIASNNTTISNETLFRVGVAEATNKSAQFGFRSTNTNGNGVAVFSVFGYNALMMVGPSDPSAGTNPIQATIYSIAPTNKVMTLITTNTGATLFHRAIEFENTTNQAVTRTNIGLGGGITTNLDIKLNDNSGMRLYFTNGILTNAVTPIP